jgi:DNA-binding MarR family transcriptional regulator
VVKPRFPEQPDFIGRLLRDLWSRFLGEMNDVVRAKHPTSTPAQARVLAMIDREGTRPAELARRAGMTRQSMNEALAGLRDAGLVEVHDDPDHGRAKVAELTPAGVQAIRDGLDAALTVHGRWTDAIGERKMAQLLKLLRELADSVSGAGPHR